MPKEETAKDGFDRVARSIATANAAARSFTRSARAATIAARSFGKSETNAMLKPPTPKQLAHRAMPFQRGNKIVRKRVYFRWCARRGFNPLVMSSVFAFYQGDR